VTNCNDIDKAWCNFKTIFTCALDSIAPIKNIRVNQRSEPWFNDEILKGIKERDKALHDYKKSNDQSRWVEYKRSRNKVQCRIDKAKEDYFKDKLSENKTNPKKLWQTLKKLGTRQKY